MADDILSCKRDSNNMESSLDSQDCDTERNEVSSMESGRNLNSKTNSNKDFSPTTQNDTHLDSKKTTCHTELKDEVSNMESKKDFSCLRTQYDKNLDSRNYALNPVAHPDSVENLDSKTPTAEVFLDSFKGYVDSCARSYLSGSADAQEANSLENTEKTTQNLDSIKMHSKPCNPPIKVENLESRKNTPKSLKQLVLFFLIGGSISLADLAGFYILYKFFEVHYILASLIMFVLASGIGVWLYQRFVFGETHLHRGLEVGLTYLINTIGIGLNALVLWLCVEFMGFEAIIAKILASFLVAFYGFYARRILIYGKESNLLKKDNK